MRKIILLFAFCALNILLVSCAQKPVKETSWAQIIEALYAPESIADISLPCTEIYTSYDRTGGNNDYSNGFKNLENGWLELVDLKGPGVLTRFWFTGLWKARIRFVFDDEEEPRLETTWDELREGKSELPRLFMSMDQNCFYSGFPLPYQKRLRVLVSDEGYSQGKGKLYFQINAVRLRGKTVDSASFPLSSDVISTAQNVQNKLKDHEVAGTELQQTFCVERGKCREIVSIEKEGTARRFRIEPDGWAAMSFHQRQLLLRQVWLGISWDHSGVNSVKVPLGDFFGQMWDPKKLQNLYFTVDDTGFECRLPMPFKQSASFTLENRGETSVSGRVLLKYNTDPVPPGYGYFHCSWNSSSEKLTGTPHEVLDVNGHGRLAGCLLGVASMDRNFWVLESDETIQRDNSKETFWQGTGLEDYFNGGWYYRTVFQNPLFGLTTKQPFRTVQYRYHLADSITFEESLNMSFERGPGNQSHGAFESVAYYYLDHPAPAPESRFVPSYLAPPKDEFEVRSLMTRLWDYEKFDDWANAEKLTRYALDHWNYPPEIKQILARRLDAYESRKSGDVITDDATVFVYSNKKSEVFLDGKRIVETADPVRAQFVQVPLSRGTHIIVVETKAGAWPDWVQVGLKKGHWIMGIDPSWKCTLEPTGNWYDFEYNDDDWNQPFGVCKGPPEQEKIPFVYPDAYVGFQSMLEGARAQKLPAGWNSKVVFRKVFEVE